jgi:hypothetical protein
MINYQSQRHLAQDNRYECQSYAYPRNKKDWRCQDRYT